MKGKFKKLIAGVSVLAMAISSFAAFSGVAFADTGIQYDYGTKMVTVTAANNETSAVLLCAEYTGNKLTSVTPYQLTFTNGTATQEVEAKINTKLMVWSKLSGGEDVIRPITESYVVPKPTIDPSTIYYKLDFENATTDTIQADTNWVGYKGENTSGTKKAARLEVLTDTKNESINKYLCFVPDSKDSGSRDVNYKMDAAAGNANEDNFAVLEFDFKANVTNASYGPAQIGFLDSDATGHKALKSDSSNVLYDGDDYIVLLSYANGGTLTVNGATAEKKVPGDAWMHVTAILNYASKVCQFNITSLDGNTEYYTGNVPMGKSADKKIQYMFLAGVRAGAGNTSVDNVMVRQPASFDDIEVYYSITYDVDGKESSEAVRKDEKGVSVPTDTAKTGYLFKGWTTDGDSVYDESKTYLTAEQIKDTPVTANIKYTAVYEKDPEYVEPMVDIKVTVPNGGLLAMGETNDNFADNNFSVQLVGEIGGDLYAQQETRVNPVKVDWKFDGFTTMVDPSAGTSQKTEDVAGADGTYTTYCGSYGRIEYDPTNPTVANFKLANQASNYYGRVTVTVTYGGGEYIEEKTITKQAAVAILANTTQPQGQYLPKAGYISDFKWYADDMVGYQATISGDNKSAVDVVTGDWAAYGGNNGRSLSLATEGDGAEATKFLKLKATGNNSSCFAVNKLAAAPTGQVIISQDVRFYTPGTAILFKQDNPVTWSDNATTFSLNFTGEALTMNGGAKVANVTAGTWYHIVLSCDVTSKLWYAKVYDMQGELLGESETEAFVNAGSTAPTYLCYRTPDNSTGEFDFNNVKMYTPEITGELETTIDNTVLSIPGEDTPADAITSANLTVTAKSTEGYNMIGAATWSIDGEPEHVTITPDAVDSHKAVLKVEEGAQPGDITVKVSLGGRTKEITVTLSSSGDSVSFTDQTRSISIPMNAGETAEATYKAHVVDNTNQQISGGDNVTYKLYDKNNVNELTTPPKGVTFTPDNEAHTAKLTVSADAEPTVVYIRATGENSEGETISRAVRVDIHGLAFDFGTTAAEGYTAVTATTAYSNTTGYGIDNGTPTAAGEGTEEDADSDSLKGAFTFKVNVPEGKLYNVTINYAGAITSEYVSADLAGHPYANETKSSVTYEIPVIDGVMDLAFNASSEVSSIVIEKQQDKAAGVKPNIYTVGDSTIANNGSWAYVLARDIAQYPDLTDIATFTNNGRGGRNLSTYYVQGELRDRVLTAIRPGDYVVIGCMGTNGTGTDFEGSFNYYIDACEAMGAKIILNSYTPHMVDGGSYNSVYNATTHTFNGVRTDGYDNTVRKIYQERTTPSGDKYDPNVVGFIDIGNMADAAFNAYVAEGADDAAKEARAQEIIACAGENGGKDHNHYSNGTKACELMLKGYGTGEDAKGIVATLVDIITADLAD